MTTRIYKVTDHEKGDFLVEASTPAAAIRHVAAKQFEAKVATTKDVAEILKRGGEIDVAGAQEKEQASVAAEPASRISGE